MNYFILDKKMMTVCIASTNSTSQKAFNVLEDDYCEYSNSPSTLDLTFDFYHENASLIGEGMYIVFKDENNKHKLFQIKQIEEQHADDSYIKVYAEENSFDLLDAVTFPATYTSVSAEYLLGILLQDTEFEVGEVSNITIESFEISNYGSVLSDLQKLAEQAECYLDFNVEFYPSKGVTRRYVDLVESYDIYNGERLEFGKNVDSIRRIIDRTPVCTAVIPIGDNDTLIRGWEWTNEWEDKTIIKPDKQSYYLCLNEEKRQEIVENSDRHLFYPLQCSGVTDQATLCKMAYDYLTKYKEPQITYEVSAIVLDDKIYHVGEEINIIDNVLNLTLSATVSEKKTSYCDPDKNEITLVNYEVKKSQIDDKIYEIQRTLQISNLDNPLLVVDKNAPLVTEQNGKPTIWVDTSESESGITFLKQWDITTGSWLTVQETPSQDKVDEDIQGAIDSTKDYVDEQTGNLADQIDIYRVLEGTTLPTSAAQGQLFVNTESGDIYQYLNGQWIQLTDNQAIQDAQTELENAQDELLAKSEELEATASELQEKANELQQQADDIQTELNNAKTDLSNTKADLQQAKEDFQATTGELSGSITNIEQDIDEINGELSNKVTQTQVNDTINGIKIGVRNYFALCNAEVNKVLAWESGNTFSETDSLTSGFIECKDGDVFTCNYSINQLFIYNANKEYICSYYFPNNDFVVKTSSPYATASPQPTDIVPAYFRITFISSFMEGKVFDDLQIILIKGNKMVDWVPAIEDMDAKVVTLGERVTVNESNITQNAKEIASKVSSSTYETDKANTNQRISKAESDIIQNADAISLSATKTEAQDYATNAVNNLEIGGTNILPKGKLVNHAGSNFSFDSVTNTYTVTTPANNTGWSGGMQLNQTENILFPYGKTLCFSMEVWVPEQLTWKVDINNTPVSGTSWNVNDNDLISSRTGITKTIPANTWTLVYWTRKNLHESNTNKLDLVVHDAFTLDTGTSAVTWKVRNPKIEFGTKPSDWSPCPLDVEDYADNAVTTAKAEIKVTTDEITQSVSSLSSTVTNQGTRLTSAEASIETQADEIALRATKTEVTNAINDIEIGGRNLLLNTGSISGYYGSLNNLNPLSSNVVTIDDTFGEVIFKDNAKTSGEEVVYSGMVSLQKGTYTASAWVKANEYTKMPVEIYGIRYDWIKTPRNNWTIPPNEWTRIYVTFEVDTDGDEWCVRVDNNATNTAGSTSRLLVCRYQLEKGNKVTDWTPAPEDAQTYTDSEISRTEAQIKVTTDAITQNVSSLTNTVTSQGTRLSAAETSIESNANSITLTAQKIDTLQIGGTNLFKESGRWTVAPTWWISSGGGLTLDTDTKYLGYNTIRTSIGYGIVGNKYQFFEVDPNKTYTYSAMVKSSASFAGTNSTPLHYHCSTTSPDRTEIGITILKYDQTLVANQWKLIYLTFKPKGAYFKPFVYVGNNSDPITLNIAYLKLEEGNRATAWTPNPDEATEYTNSSVSSAKSEIKQTTDAITQSVTNLSNTVTSQGNRLTSAEASITTNAGNIALKVGKTELLDYKTSADNLIKNGNFANGTFDLWTKVGGVTTSFGSEYSIGTYLKFSQSAVGSSQVRIYPSTEQVNFQHTSGQTYTLSFMAKADSAVNLITNVSGNTAFNNKANALTTEWQKFTYSYTAATSGSATFWLDKANVNAYLTNVSIVLGNEDWNTRINATNTRIDQTDESITLTAEKIDGLVIGGRNYFKNADFTKVTTYANYNFTVNGTTYNYKHADGFGGYNGGIANPTTNFHAYINDTTFSVPVYEYNESNGSRNWKGVVHDVTGRVTESGVYTISLDLYATGTGTKIYGGFYYTKTGATSPSFYSGQYSITPTETNKWVRMSAQTTLKEDVDWTKKISFYMYGYGFSTNSILYMKNPKLEKGNSPTAFSLAPEDGVDYTNDAVNSAKASIEITTDGITQNVSNLTTTVNNHTTQIDTANTNIASNANSISINATKIDTMKISGENLISTADLEDGYIMVSGDTLGGVSELRQERTSANIPVKVGEKLFFQCWVTIPSDVEDPSTEYLWMAYQFYNDADERVGDRGGGLAYTNAELLPNGQRYNCLTIESVPTGATYIRVTARMYGDGKIKLERGTKPTDWSINPTEVATRIQNAEIAIESDKIISTVLESESYAEIVKAYALQEDIQNMATKEDVTTAVDGIDHKAKIDERINEQLSDEQSSLSLNLVTQTQLKQTKTDYLMTFRNASGLNLLKNSLGFNGVNDGNWITGTPNLYTGTNPSAYTNITVGTWSATITTSLVIADLGLHIGDWITYQIDLKASSSTKQLSARLDFFNSSGTSMGGNYGNVIATGASGTSALNAQIPEGAVKIALYISNVDGSTVTENSTEQYCKVRLAYGKNESGYFPYTFDDSDYIVCGYDPDAEQIGFDSSIHFIGKTSGNTRIKQKIPTIIGEVYTVSYYVKNTTGGNHSLIVKDYNLEPISAYVPEGEEDTTTISTVNVNGYQFVSYSFVAPTSSCFIGWTIPYDQDVFITGLMVNIGNKPFAHGFAKGEVYNTNINFDASGIKVMQLNKEGNIVGYTMISPTEFAGYYDTDGDGAFEKIFYLNQDAVVSKRSVAEKEIIMGKLKFINMDDTTYKGWALIPSTTNDWQLSEGADETE